MKKQIVLLAFLALALYGCDGTPNRPSAIPGAAGAHLYDMMEEEDTAAAKTDTTHKEQ